MLFRSTNVPGFFGAGNVVQVYDLVDSVSAAAAIAGRSAALYAAGQSVAGRKVIPVGAGRNVRSVVPQRIHPGTLDERAIPLQLRVSAPIERAVELQLCAGASVLARKRFPYARPGEMITVPIARSLRNAVEEADALRIDAVPADELTG